MNAKLLNLNKVLSVRSFRIAVMLVGIIIVLFNDAFGKIEGFIEFLFLYFIIVCITVLHWLFVNIKLLINLKNEKAKTELMHLQSQVNPHFFFNMLNNLYGLVGKDTEKAQKLILKLSDMMRYSIYEGQKTYVTLKEEIDYISNYIELHKMRYHKKIIVNVVVEVENDNLKLMPLLLIILVENAFKHGVEVLRDNAFVHISITSQQNEVCLVVQNNFDTAAESKSGIGLTNLKRRLALAYPQKHVLTHVIDHNIHTAKLTVSV